MIAEMAMNVLLLGSGGREHELAWKMAASPLVDRLYCAPGNAGIPREVQCVAIDPADHVTSIAFCCTNRIDFVVVGPEGPLCAGTVDDLEAVGIKTLGPTRAAARLEGSKGFTKDLCRANGIPTAAYERFRAPEAAKTYVRSVGVPIVIKADGLAAGKGVIVAQSIAEANSAIDLMVAGGLGPASTEIVIEEFLAGEEAPLFALCRRCGRTGTGIASRSTSVRGRCLTPSASGWNLKLLRGCRAGTPSTTIPCPMARVTSAGVLICGPMARGAGRPTRTILDPSARRHSRRRGRLRVRGVIGMTASNRQIAKTTEIVHDHALQRRKEWTCTRRRY
jgi:Phosphoribosylglycinamide synthetase, N domain/Phosphoribosylglycinamide synthetase, ATP-grasp (A) domain